VGFELDESALKKSLRELSRLVHPDFHTAGASELRELAERNSAALNDAFKTLSDRFKRADFLIRQLGGPADSDERQMPQAFLMEVMEWNEELEEAKQSPVGSPQRAGLERLKTTLEGERESAFATIAEQLEGLPRDTDQLTAARRQLNAVRYIDNTLEQLRALRLTESASN